ncbi:MAG: T9SS type A sorting domain-containing protein [Bacteroides sp.]|nr:T9SS type A sorting domain-containing protein [Bacteroides sp.]MCM1380071.1 T9SS type A sorting domain-containing protein [Bacteroides sp.]MCM1446408.1 T9SS type A sorting domain-containing protein [Prevotella sp.]
MNKVFTLVLFAAAALSAAAQNFTVRDAYGKTYADGDAVNIGYSFDGIGYNWAPGLEVTVNQASSLLGGSNFKVTVTASEADIVQFCGLTGLCSFVGSEPITHTATYNAGASFGLDIEILARTANLTSAVTATVTIADDTESMTLIVNFLPSKNAGISDVSNAANSVTFAGRTMYFSLATTEKFSLYNISGRTVADRTLSGSGSLNLGNLPAGLYIYRIGKSSGKVILH